MRNPILAEFRLDHILLEKAKTGVNIYIQIYNEPLSSLNLNSYLAKKYLRELHPRIKVIRTPNRLRRCGNIPIKEFIYSHHQKLVVIDRNVGFVGGIDLCPGRYNVKRSEALMDDLGTVFPGKFDHFLPPPFTEPSFRQRLL